MCIEDLDILRNYDHRGRLFKGDLQVETKCEANLVNTNQPPFYSRYTMVFVKDEYWRPIQDNQ